MDPVVILSTDEIALVPGDSVQVGARVLNRGRRVEAYRIDVIGDAAPFATVAPTAVSVLPGREEQVQITFVAPTGPDARPGAHRFGVRAVSEVDPTSSALAEGRVDLQGAGGVHGWFPESVAAGRWSGRYELQLANRGNAPVRLAVTAHEPTGELRVEAVPDVVELLPGAPTTVTVEAKARRPFVQGRPVSRSLQVATHDFPFGSERPTPGAQVDRADPHHHQFQLQFEQRPILGKWVLALVALLVVAIVGAVVLAFRGGSEVTLEVGEPFTPIEFRATTLGSSEVALAWRAVPNAANYEVWPSEPDGTTPANAEEFGVEGAATTVDGLDAGTEFCFKVRSVGFDDQKSDFTDPTCVVTGEPAVVPIPVLVSATAMDPSTIEVVWTYPPDRLADVEGFTLIVDNRELPDRIVKRDGERQDATITVDASPSGRVVGIRVRAVTAEGASDASDEVEVPVPAMPTTTTTGGDSGGNGDGETTTTAPDGDGTGATTIPPLTTPLPGLEPEFQERWAVMVPVIETSGVSAQSLAAELAAVVGSAPSAVEDFFNRDKFVLESMEPTQSQYTAEFISGVTSAIGKLEPDQRWLYLGVRDDDAALDACAALVAENPQCVSVLLRSAGHPGALVRPLERLGRDATVDELDARVSEFRSENPAESIHVLDSLDWAEFDGDDWVLFVRVESDQEPQLCGGGSACVELTPAP